MKTDYTNFNALLHRVPVQYGRYGREPRKVRLLGMYGNLDAVGEVVYYYRIEVGQPGGGRIFEVRRIKDEKGALWDYIGYVLLRDIVTVFPDLLDGVKHGWPTQYGPLPVEFRYRDDLLKLAKKKMRAQASSTEEGMASS